MPAIELPGSIRPPIFLGINEQSLQSNGLVCWWPGGTHRCIVSGEPESRVGTASGDRRRYSFTKTTGDTFDTNRSAVDLGLSKALTFSCWCRPATSSGAQGLLGDWPSGSRSILAGNNNGTWYWQTFDSVGAKVNTAGSVAANVVTHYCGQWSGTLNNTCYLWINGVAVDSFSTNTATLGTGGATYHIGEITASTWPWDGDIWDLRIYNTLLRNEDVARIYNSPYDLWKSGFSVPGTEQAAPPAGSAPTGNLHGSLYGPLGGVI